MVLHHELLMHHLSCQTSIPLLLSPDLEHVSRLDLWADLSVLSPRVFLLLLSIGMSRRYDDQGVVWAILLRMPDSSTPSCVTVVSACKGLVFANVLDHPLVHVSDMPDKAISFQGISFLLPESYQQHVVLLLNLLH